MLASEMGVPLVRLLFGDLYRDARTENGRENGFYYLLYELPVRQ